MFFYVFYERNILQCHEGEIKKKTLRVGQIVIYLIYLDTNKGVVQLSQIQFPDSYIFAN